MNDDFTELENELRALPLRGPSAECLSRIGRALAAESAAEPTPSDERPAAAPGWSGWLLPVGLAAACLAGLLLWPAGPHAPAAGEPTAQASGLVPVAAEKILCDSREEGWVSLPGGAPALRVRRDYVDIYTWRDPRTNASLRWAVPREEVRVIPVSAY